MGSCHFHPQRARKHQLESINVKPACTTKLTDLSLGKSVADYNEAQVAQSHFEDISIIVPALGHFHFGTVACDCFGGRDQCNNLSFNDINEKGKKRASAVNPVFACLSLNSLFLFRESCDPVAVVFLKGKQ